MKGSNRLADKVAIITGAGGGIGRATARLFAEEGATVAVVDLNEETAAETARLIEAEGGRARVWIADITSRDRVHALFGEIEAAFGGIDILVNNAMWISYDLIPDVTEETVDRMLAIGVKALFWTTQAAEAPMARRGGGAIVNMASIAAVRGGDTRMVYCAVKGAVDGMTRATAAELGPKGIRVNAIGPGAVLNPGTAERLGPERIQLRLDTTPLRRLAENIDVARVALFLASADSGFVTGTLTIVDGGRAITS